MVAETRKMYELKNKIREILEREKYTCDMFNGAIEAGLIDSVKLDEFVKQSGMTERYDEVIKVTKAEIYENSYLKNINITDIEHNNIRLTKKRIIFRNTLASYNEKKRNTKTFEQENQYFICENTLKLPAIVEKDNKICWMTVEPIEINSFKTFIEEAKGNVLLIGCGLGYVAHMLSLKEEVKSITIIDNNLDILELFNLYILPQFNNKEKIMTMCDDAISFLNKSNLSLFDYINIDIWHDIPDMICPYLECIEIEKKYPGVNFSYWLENELKEAVQKNILKAIAEYDDEKLILDEIGKYIVKNTDINKKEDVENLLELPNMRDILYNWYLNNYSNFLELKEQQEQKTQLLAQKSNQFLKTLK